MENKLVITKSEVKVIDMPNKPEFIGAMENVKVRDYSPEEAQARSAIATATILKALVVSGSEENEKLHEEVIEMILHEYKHLTFEEILYAFKVYRQGKLYENDKKMIPMQYLNTVIFSRVMSAYEDFKRKSPKLDEYYKLEQKALAPPTLSQKEIDEINKNGRMNMYNLYKDMGDLPSGYTVVYDELDTRGLINFSREDKMRIYEKTKELNELI